jgi:hypothetical protein
MGVEEPLTVVTARVTATESQWAKDLGSGNASAGIRRAIRAAHELQKTGTTAQPDARLSQLLEQALKLAHGLEAAAAADVTSTPSGAGWMPKPTGDLILEFHRLMPGVALAMPQGLMVWGKGESGSGASLSVDVAGDLLALSDLACDADAEVVLDGVGGVAALIDVLSQAHHLARLAVAKGRPVSSAMAECPALKLRVRPADAEGLAVIELAGATIRLPGLAFLQLWSESTSLLARLVAQSAEQRHSLEQLVSPQRTPAVAWERSHGDS